MAQQLREQTVFAKDPGLATSTHAEPLTAAGIPSSTPSSGLHSHLNSHAHTHKQTYSHRETHTEGERQLTDRDRHTHNTEKDIHTQLQKLF